MHYFHLLLPLLAFNLTNLNYEIIKNKTSSSQTLGLAPVNNLTKDHIKTDGVNETFQTQSLINTKKEITDKQKVLNKNIVVQK